MNHPAFVLSAFLMLVTAFSPAASAEETPSSEAYGLVKAIDGSRMTVTVLDPATGASSDQVFTLAAETRLVIVRPASEVVVGDEVRVQYQDGGDKKAEFVSILDLPASETPSAA